MKSRESTLRANLSLLMQNDEAVNLCLDYFTVAQFWDDLNSIKAYENW